VNTNPDIEAILDRVDDDGFVLPDPWKPILRPLLAEAWMFGYNTAAKIATDGHDPATVMHGIERVIAYANGKRDEQETEQ